MLEEDELLLSMNMNDSPIRRWLQLSFLFCKLRFILFLSKDTHMQAHIIIRLLGFFHCHSPAHKQCWLSKIQEIVAFNDCMENKLESEIASMQDMLSQPPLLVTVAFHCEGSLVVVLQQQRHTVSVHPQSPPSFSLRVNCQQQRSWQPGANCHVMPDVGCTCAKKWDNV